MIGAGKTEGITPSSVRIRRLRKVDWKSFRRLDWSKKAVAMARKKINSNCSQRPKKFFL